MCAFRPCGSHLSAANRVAPSSSALPDNHLANSGQREAEQRAARLAAALQPLPAGLVTVGEPSQSGRRERDR